MNTVSKENLRKVEDFFIRTIKESGENKVEATVVDIADNSNVALATAHKAIKELSQRGVLNIIKPSSRRFPITYVYNGDLSELQVSRTKDEQIALLKNVIDEKNTEISALKQRLDKLEKMLEKKFLQNV